MTKINGSLRRNGKNQLNCHFDDDKNQLNCHFDDDKNQLNCHFDDDKNQLNCHFFVPRNLIGAAIDLSLRRNDKNQLLLSSK
jgi:hypothetical protein